MSAMSIFLRRPSACWTATSIDAPASAARIVWSASCPDNSSGTGMSHAISGASHSMVVAPSALLAIFAIAWLSFAAFGLEMSVATSAIGVSGFAGGSAMLKGATLIAGPTASGKSARALELAERNDGVIVNADSMQVYSVLSLLTARPGADETAAVPHRLFGH